MSFQLEMKELYLEIKLEDDTGLDDETLFKKRIDFEYNKKSFEFIFVECSQLKVLGPKLLNALVQYSRELKKTNKRGGVRFYQINDKLHFDLKNKGLDGVLPCFKSIKGALTDAGLETAKNVDVGLINPMISSVISVLEAKTGVKTESEKPYVRKPSDPTRLGDLSSSMQLRSEVFEGTFSICFSEGVFKMLFEKFTGKECPQPITKENIEIAGQLSLVIIKQSKEELHKAGYYVENLNPVVYFKNEPLPKIIDKEASVIVVPFKCNVGSFFIEISTTAKKYVPKKDQAA